jgi:hypothetical protein
MKSSGWEFTDADNWVGCPKCGQPAGKVCRTPKGRKAIYPHGERVQALRQHPEYNQKNYIGEALCFNDWIKKYLPKEAEKKGIA